MLDLAAGAGLKHLGGEEGPEGEGGKNTEQEVSAAVQLHSSCTRVRCVENGIFHAKVLWGLVWAPLSVRCILIY